MPPRIPDSIIAFWIGDPDIQILRDGKVADIRRLTQEIYLAVASEAREIGEVGAVLAPLEGGEVVDRFLRTLSLPRFSSQFGRLSTSSKLGWVERAFIVRFTRIAPPAACLILAAIGIAKLWSDEQLLDGIRSLFHSSTAAS